MPDMSGFDAISQMRANLIEAPICILSEVGNAASKIRALELGADDYIQLPIKAEELTARIEAIIRRASGHIASHLDIGDIRIDNRARVVFFCGQSGAADEQRIHRVGTAGQPPWPHDQQRRYHVTDLFWP